MEDLISVLQTLAKSWREVAPVSGGRHLEIAADQLESVLRNHQGVQSARLAASPSVCPDGHGSLIVSGDMRFCPTCKYTVSR